MISQSVTCTWPSIYTYTNKYSSPVYYNALTVDILRGRAENLFAPAWYVLSCFSCWASDGLFFYWWWMFTNTLLFISLIVDSTCIDHFILLTWYLQWIKFGNGSICSYTTGSHFCCSYIPIIPLDQVLDHSHLPVGPGYIIMYEDHIPNLNSLKSICTFHLMKLPKSCQILLFPASLKHWISCVWRLTILRIGIAR